MASGGKQVKINNLERAVSNDLNRAQSLESRNLAEMLRRLIWQRGVSPVEFGMVADTTSADAQAIGAGSTGIRADVFDGLLPLPQTGSLSIFISPGAVGLEDPDGQTGSSDSNPPSADDSRYKIVSDAGIQTLGVLTIAAGGGGGTRIDVIECQRTTIVTETSSRDIYNTSTGLFTPATVDKVVSGELTYRVRQGTAGAGYPGVAQGWLPLAVVAVPTTATTVDTMTFWDVRPLVSARVYGMRHGVSMSHKNICEGHAYVDPATSKLIGSIMRNDLLGYHFGGEVGEGNTIDLDLSLAANKESGYAANNNGMWHVVAYIPDQNLPRWVRYVSGFPVGPSGLWLLSSAVPGPTGTTTITPPSSSGFTGAGVGIHMMSGVNSGTTFKPAVIENDVNWVAQLLSVSPSSSVLLSDSYSIGSTSLPGDTKQLRVSFQTEITGTASSPFTIQYTLEVYKAGTTNVIATLTGYLSGEYDASNNAFLSFTADIPKHDAATSVDCKVSWASAAGIGPASRSNQSAKIEAWRY